MERGSMTNGVWNGCTLHHVKLFNVGSSSTLMWNTPQPYREPCHQCYGALTPSPHWYKTSPVWNWTSEMKAWGHAYTKQGGTPIWRTPAWPTKIEIFDSTNFKYVIYEYAVLHRMLSKNEYNQSFNIFKMLYCFIIEQKQKGRYIVQPSFITECKIAVECWLILCSYALIGHLGVRCTSTFKHNV